jgi:hypothetical protein
LSDRGLWCRGSEGREVQLTTYPPSLTVDEGELRASLGILGKIATWPFKIAGTTYLLLDRRLYHSSKDDPVHLGAIMAASGVVDLSKGDLEFEHR